ncbi:MAG: DUF1513 domain-containing protein [Candidatus Competibacteraceae bacterium]|jgi:hypothetical protein|nr:DUF1513 domain-containing protein [Candidatus Competibacteraceae bacterium]
MFTDQGRIAWSHDLSSRGHAIAINPRRTEAAVLARRPGTFIVVVDLRTQAPIRQIESLAGRHFYGHGVYDPEGRLLYATENDYEAGIGVIGIYDAADGYRRLGEFPSYGIGPHELKFLNDGITLVVANGGIRTHPDTGRAKLNLADMQANLTYVNATSGMFLDAYHLPKTLQQLSIRHIAVAAGDKVCIAMQYQGKTGQHPPLVATHQGQETLHLLSAPEPIQTAMRNYCGSVAIDTSGQLCAVTSPRGGLITLWSMTDGQFLGSSTLVDCCGISAGEAASEFLVTNGDGTVARLTPNNGGWTLAQVAKAPSIRWDNHLTTSDTVALKS